MPGAASIPLALNTALPAGEVKNAMSSRAGHQRRAVGRDLLQRGGQQADDDDAVDEQQFAHLLDGDVGLAPAQQLGCAALGLSFALLRTSFAMPSAGNTTVSKCLPLVPRVG